MRILIAGDSHCDVKHVEYLYERARKMDCTKILQVGDFGFWPRARGGPDFLVRIEQLAMATGIRWYWVDGNHEDHDVLAATVKGVRDEFVQISNHNFYSPRGHCWEWDGVKFLSVGGAYSIDRGARTHGIDWFSEEVISEEDVAAAIKAGKVDVLVSHDAPQEVDMVATFSAAGKRMYEFDQGTIINRERLQRIVNATNPSIVLHGHWHHQYSWRSELVQGRKIIGLGFNYKPSGSWTVLDTDDLHPERRAELRAA